MSFDHATMSLDDEMPWRSGFPAERQDFYDDHGFTFCASTDEHDIMLGNFIYNFQGGASRPRSQWLGDGFVNNNLVVITPKERRGKGMYNNNFSRAGMNLTGFRDSKDVSIVRGEDSVVWKFGDLTYTCKPPYWHVSGRSGEQEYDLHFTQLDKPVVWSYGTREHAIKTGLGGGYVYVNCEGTLKIAGETYRIEKGRGVHERLVFSETMDHIANVATDQNGFGTGFAMHILEGDCWVWGLGAYNDPMFFLTVEGKPMEFIPSKDGSKVVYTPLDPWHDVRSGLYMPSRWRVELESSQGRLELESVAMGRAYYPWELKNGYQIMYWHLGLSNGKFTYPDGREVVIKDQLSQHELVKNIIVYDERMSGPNLTPIW